MNSLDKAFQALVEHGVSFPLAAYLVNLESRVILLERELEKTSAVAPNREAGAGNDSSSPGPSAAEAKNKEVGMKCSQSNCEELSTYSYVWPGREDRSFACDKHIDAASKISNAMGFSLGDLRYEQQGVESVPQGKMTSE